MNSLLTAQQVAPRECQQAHMPTAPGDAHTSMPPTIHLEQNGQRFSSRKPQYSPGSQSGIAAAGRHGRERRWWAHCSKPKKNRVHNVAEWITCRFCSKNLLVVRHGPHLFIVAYSRGRRASNRCMFAAPPLDSFEVVGGDVCGAVRGPPQPLSALLPAAALASAPLTSGGRIVSSSCTPLPMEAASSPAPSDLRSEPARATALRRPARL